MTRLKSLWLLAVVVLAASAACGANSPATSQDEGRAVRERNVSFQTTDGLRLTGRAFGQGRSAIILTHMFPAENGAESWYAAARRFARAGYIALAFNFRGYATSKGPKAIARAPIDIEAAARFLEEHGARDLAFVGASMGGTASIIAADTLNPLAIVAISAPLRFMGLDAPDVAGRVQRPVLLLAARGDGPAFAAVQELERALPNPEARIYEGDAHGTNLLEDRPEAVDEIISFLDRYIPPQRSRSTP